MPASRPLAERFAEQYTVNADGCWIWTGTKLKTGYGGIGAGGRHGRHLRAHRASWEIHRGPIPEGEKVRHRCDVRLCVNPDHLQLGSQRDNILDMVERGRRRGGTRGASIAKSVLTDESVREIRQRYAAGGVTYKALAAEYGVTFGAISHVVSRRTWKHVL